jgi:hypothetical protein
MDAKQSTPSPFFGFPPEILSALDREIQYIGRIVDRELGRCGFESPERCVGACDGGVQCQKRATVHDLNSGEEFCLEHFEGVIL